MDDILLCTTTETECEESTQSLLNFLADCGCKVSHQKAQICQQQVKYLGLNLPQGTRALGEERIQPILCHPLPSTIRHLRGFLGITGYCRIWVPRYGELARPLYQILKEAQREGTIKLQWEPDAFKAYEALKKALLQAPALILPTGNRFNLFVTERLGVALGVLTQPLGEM